MNTAHSSACSYSLLGQPLKTPTGIGIRPHPIVVYM